MRVALFGGSFDPVHREHVRLVRAAAEYLGLEKVIVMPSAVAPHKMDGARADGDARLELCRIAFSALPYAEVSDYELTQAGVSYTYLTCRMLEERFPDAERFLLVGADMLENFFSWKNPDEIVARMKIAACGRGGEETEGCSERFRARFGHDVVHVPFMGEDVSSTRIRTLLAFGKEPEELDGAVLRLIRERGLYAHPAILPALSLEKEERQAHSLRVALMATERARSAGVSEERALLASALHDCAKYLPFGHALLEGFCPEERVPPPVLHQYTGAYVAEHAFGVTDEEVLDAIRYHTSGRAGMTKLGMLVYLADLLEPARSFKGAEYLRALFEADLALCMEEALKSQIEYLKRTGLPVYPRTLEAYEWSKKAALRSTMSRING